MTTDTVDGELYNNYWVVEYNPESASVRTCCFFIVSQIVSNHMIQMYMTASAIKTIVSAMAQESDITAEMHWMAAIQQCLPRKITVTNEEKLVATITCMRQGQDNKPLSFDMGR